jgi:hypothetical protein
MRALLACEDKSVSNKSHVCDDCIDVPLCMFILSQMCAACLLVHGSVDDKKCVCTQTLKLLCNPLLPLKVMGCSLKLVQSDLTYYL